jgi:hypothetical protein
VMTRARDPLTEAEVACLLPGELALPAALLSMDDGGLAQKMLALTRGGAVHTIERLCSPTLPGRLPLDALCAAASRVPR